MTNEKLITCRSARLVPALLLIASIWMGSTRSGWWFLSIPFIAVGWLGAVPNLNLANGILAYLSMIGGLILLKFHEPSGAAIAAGAAAGFYLSALEMRITAKALYPTEHAGSREQRPDDQAVSGNRRSRLNLNSGFPSPVPPLYVVQKMEEPTIDERKRWWLLYYGITSMEKAIKSCDLIAHHCTTNADPLFQPLSLAVHAFYARPFKGNGAAGKLPRDLVPEGAKGIHSWLEHFRDGVMSHIDPRVSETAGHPMNDVVYTISGSERQFSTLEARPSVEAYSDARAHCEMMIDVFQDSITGFLERFHTLLPQNDGQHLLSITDGTPLFIDGYVMPVRSNLNYK